jgi:hypothetical protein
MALADDADALGVGGADLRCLCHPPLPRRPREEAGTSGTSGSDYSRCGLSLAKR